MENRHRVRARVTIQGRVQGVGFRAFAHSHAARRGLSGWVRNLSDGRVETEVEGAGALVDEFIGALKQGPLLAHVQDVRVEWPDPVARDSAFEIRA